jgi:flavin-dependent dehydrogenase
VPPENRGVVHVGHDLETQVLVAGAGVAGLLATHALTQAGLECMLVERRPRTRWSDHWCVEVDSHSILSQVIPSPSPECVLHRGEDGVDVFSPSGRKAFTLSPFPVYSIRLWEYEKQLLKPLASVADVRFDTSLVDFAPADQGRAVCTLRQGEATTRVRCDLVVLATGLSFDLDRQIYAHAGIKRKLPDSDFMSARHETWTIDPEAMPTSGLPVPPGVEGFFPAVEGPLSVTAVWVDKALSVGAILAGTMSEDGYRPPDQLLSGLRDKYRVFRDRLSSGGATIPVRRPVEALVGRSVALIGNAAAQAHPMTGCGVALSGHAAHFLADAAREYCRDGRRIESLWPYNTAYQSRFGASQAAAEVMARFLRRNGRDSNLVETLFGLGVATAEDLQRSTDLRIPLPTPSEFLSRVGAFAAGTRKTPGLLPMALRMAAAAALYRRFYPSSPDMLAVRAFTSRAQKLVQG